MKNRLCSRVQFINDIFSLLKFIFDDYTLQSLGTVLAKLTFLIFTHFRMSTPINLSWIIFLFCNVVILYLLVCFFLLDNWSSWFSKVVHWDKKSFSTNFQYLYFLDTFCIKKNNWKKNHQLIKDYSMYQSLNQMKYTVPLY